MNTCDCIDTKIFHFILEHADSEDNSVKLKVYILVMIFEHYIIASCVGQLCRIKKFRIYLLC